MSKNLQVTLIAFAIFLTIAFYVFSRDLYEDKVLSGNEKTYRGSVYESTVKKSLKDGADVLEVNGTFMQLPEYVVLREQKMRRLFTGSPVQYYTMKLWQLRELANNGDAYAMLQLAEQYLNEDARIRSDPEYPVDGSTRDLAKQYLSNAFLAGRVRAAALLSKQLFDENQAGEAYVWRLVSERVGDGTNPLWPGDSNQFSSLSNAERLAAEDKATALLNVLKENQMRESENARLSNTAPSKK